MHIARLFGSQLKKEAKILAFARLLMLIQQQIQNFPIKHADVFW